MSGVVKACYKVIQDYSQTFESARFIVGVSRGGLIPAAIIATKLNKPLVVAYINKEDEVFLDRGEWLAGGPVVVIDDAVRTGKTMEKILELVSKASVPYTVTGVTIFKAKDMALNLPVSSAIVKGGSIKFPWDINDKEN